MNDVVVLKTKKEPQIWVCNCGCSTFELLSTSEVRCPLCELVSEAPDGSWYAPETEKTWEGEPPMRDISGNGSVDFARHVLARRASDPDVAMIIVCGGDGTLSVWSAVQTQEQLAWFRRQIETAYELTAKKLDDA